MDATLVMEFLRECVRELMLTLQAIPLILQLSTTTLGTATLYRTTITSLLASVQTLSRTFDQTYQGIFLLAAFSASSSAQPTLEPATPVPITTSKAPEGEGMEIECKNLWYTYPGSEQATIRGLNLKIGKGESIAVVGSNGSGKSTLMNLLLRLFAYDGELDQATINDPRPRVLINGIDARLISPAELHARSSAVFQGFCKFAGASVKENVGVGAVKNLEDEAEGPRRLERALRDGVAAKFVSTLPMGMDTRLDVTAFSSGSPMAMSPTGSTMAFPTRSSLAMSRGGGGMMVPTMPFLQMPMPKKKPKVGLSGGQWQRLALSRLFMRGRSSSTSPSQEQPPALILLDEASSQLDPMAERAVMAKLRKRFPKATIVFITHRLETVRWADKVAFFQDGTITELGRHSELLGMENGGYAAMWRDFEGGIANEGSRSETTATGVEDGEEEDLNQD